MFCMYFKDGSKVTLVRGDGEVHKAIRGDGDPAKVDHVEANDEELLIVLENITGIRGASYRSKPMYWFGDDAVFIAANLVL